VEEAPAVSQPDFERMTKDEVIAWFRTTNDLSPMLADMQPATEPAGRAVTDGPMLLASIRLPVAVVEELDHLASRQGVRRSDIIREALSTYIAEKTAPVGRDEAERALDVLRRVVADRTSSRVA
jgi:predicted DNA-binding protein